MSSQKIVKPDAAGIAAAAKAAQGRGMPPVDKWNPPFCGDLDMWIRKDGVWFYEGTPIGRPGMVRLFSTILRKDGADYFLVTPVEKVGIRVEDAPFVAVDVEPVDSGLKFVTTLGDEVIAGPDAPIRVVPGDEPRPYVTIRRNLEALIDRKTFYRLVDLGTVVPHEGTDWFGVHSGGMFFPIIEAARLG